MAQNRYMSSSEYVEMRGINGHAVTAKASILSSARKRSLLYFLQGMSLENDGLPGFVCRLLEMFPDRIGTATMHKAGLTGNQRYTQEQCGKIEEELNLPEARDRREAEWFNTPVPQVDDEGNVVTATHTGRWKVKPVAIRTAECFLRICREVATRDLPELILELCINPRVEFAEPGGNNEHTEDRATTTVSPFACLGSDDFEPWGVPYFKDIIGALFAFQEATAKAPASDFEDTTVSRKVFKALEDAVNHPDRVYVVEGVAGLGKSRAASIWVKRNAGRARYVSLSGAATKTTIFRAIAKALGLASSYTRKANELQMHIEDMLKRSKLLLVIDEALYLVGGGERATTRPELLDWIYTALANFRVPTVLICTPVFARRVRMAEEKTVWNSLQFWSRTTARVLDPLSKEDLERVTRKLLPECGKREIEFVRDYGIVSKACPLRAIVAAIEDARDIAKEQNRPRINFDDLEQAIEGSRLPSDDAKARAFTKPPKRVEGRLQDGFKSFAPSRNLAPESTTGAIRRADSAELADA